MVGSSTNGGHQDVIRRLLEAEKDAGEMVRKAREAGEETVERAKREADERIKEAMAAAEAEAEAMIREAEDLAGEAVDAARSPTFDIETLRRHAQENMEQAVRFLVDQVTETHE